MKGDLTEHKQEALAEKLAPFAVSGIGLAVSGGSDSLAMLYILANWAAEAGAKLTVATVDHRLRAESVHEAEMVARHSAELGLSHEILTWRDWNGKGNLQAEARKARLDLLTDWANRNALGAVALAHTLDDVAETFLMRLGRGAGVDGLAQMAARRKVNGVTILRPMLSFRREELRDFLRARRVEWADDPSNADAKYDRVRLRNILPDLAETGVGTEGIASSAKHLNDTAKALDFYVHAAAEEAVNVTDCDVVINFPTLARHPFETQRRLIVGVIKWMTDADYAPRGQSIVQLFAQVKEQGRTVLAGCVFSLKRDALYITRELAAVKNIVAAPTEIWDGRWRLSGQVPEESIIRALGEEGLLRCPEWRETGRTRMSLLVSPALWDGEELLAAPLAGLSNGVSAEPQKHKEDLLQSLLSH